MTYLALKSIHLLSMVLLFGTGLGSAFYKFMTDRRGDVAAIASTNRLVVLADWLFTTPTIVIQPITGIALAKLAGWPLTTPWIAAALGLYLVAGICWLPVVWLQIRMRELSEACQRTGSPLPPQYRRLARIWFWLGVPAFIAMVTVVGIMVFKPA
jgi:uncharacterized membrane protein